MSMPRKADAALHLRRRAVQLTAQGRRQVEVAGLLNVSVRSIQRWRDTWVAGGDGELAHLSERHSGGRPPKLDAVQTRQVLAWLDRDPGEFGFPTQWWTAPRIASLIERRFGISMNKRYLNDWLRRHDITPQMPEQSARERDQERIDGWVRWQWPRIKKRRPTCTRRSVLPMNPASGWRLWPAEARPGAATRRRCASEPNSATRCRSRRR